jgi:hypothetical protein
LKELIQEIDNRSRLCVVKLEHDQNGRWFFRSTAIERVRVMVLNINGSEHHQARMRVKWGFLSPLPSPGLRPRTSLEDGVKKKIIKKK